MTDLRVLVVMPLGEPLGGGEMMFRQLMRYGTEYGVEWIAAFTQEGPTVAEVRAFGIETHLVRVGLRRRLSSHWRATRALAALAKERQVSLIVGWTASAQLLAGPAAWIADIPCAWCQIALPRPDWLDRIATLLPARGVLVPSEQIAAAQARVRPRRAQRLVFPGASLDRFDAVQSESPTALRARFGLPAAGPLIGMVGRLHHQNGMPVAIEAMPEVRERHPQAHLVIVGGAHDPESQCEPELRTLVARLGLESAVTFAGFQSDLPRWMQAMDIVVHFSDREPLGRVVIEAMALGKPVIAGAAGGPTEIITSGVDGLLAPFDDPAALAARINCFLDEPELALRCGTAARVRAADFSAERYAKGVSEAVLSFALAEEA